MSKKLITACMALFALAAFALPAGASATVLTHPTGTAMCPSGGTTSGCLITATNVGEAIFKSGTTPLVECNHVTMTGNIVQNNSGVVKGNVTTATFTGSGPEYTGMKECSGLGGTTVTTNGGGVDGETVTNGTPWCIQNGAGDTVLVRGGLCTQAQRAINFVLHSTSFGTCEYSRAAAIEGTATTDTTGDALVSLTSTGTEFTKSGGGILCPSKGTLEMTYTLETDQETASPVYFSE